MMLVYLTRSPKSRRLLSLFLKSCQFNDNLHVSVQLLVAPTIHDWRKYNMLLNQNGTFRSQVMEAINVLKREGYDVTVVVRQTS